LTEIEPLERTIEEHRPFTGVPMPAPTRPDALTSTEPRAIAATLTFELSVQTICSSWFAPSKTRSADELEIVTTLVSFTCLKRIWILELEIETEAEVALVPVMEKGKVIG
jgi:hypothetical protein